MSIEANDAPLCNHSALGKPPTGMRIAACPSCGQVFCGYAREWDVTTQRVNVPFTDNDVFHAAVRAMLNSGRKNG